MQNTPHRRYNPLIDEWVLVSPHRALRPWSGKNEETFNIKKLPYDEKCYLCPGNTRVSGEKNLQYKNTYVFENDHQAILPIEMDGKENNNKDVFFKSMEVGGTCRVMCFSPRHDLTLGEMDIKDIQKVIEEWIKQSNELKKKYAYVQIFENKGEIMGCSNPHPHCQIWASNFIPNQVQKEDANQLHYYKKNNSPLLIDYVNAELEKKERIIFENDDWVVLVPYWAIWPYETMLIPKRHILRLTGLNNSEKYYLAHITKLLLSSYDKLFNVSFPYSMGWHGSPFNQEAGYHWQVHAHYYPPLLRSAHIKKFMVGYEMLAEAQRDITPEQAAEQLKNLFSVFHE